MFLIGHGRRQDAFVNREVLGQGSEAASLKKSGRRKVSQSGQNESSADGKRLLAQTTLSKLMAVF